MQLHDGIRVYSQSEMYQIHQAMLRILQEVGLELQISQASLEKLAARGLEVDYARRRVRVPAEAVLETIQMLSGAATPEVTPEGTCRPPQPLRVPKRLKASVGALHGFVYDVGEGRMRPATHQDMYDLLKVKRHLKGVECTSAGLCPQDVPADVALVHAAVVAVTYCKNPSAPDPKGTSDLVWIERVMQAAGAWGPDRHLAANIYPASPLRLAGRGAELMEFQAARGDLSFVIGMVIPGASCPITLASHTVMILAEELGLSTVYRLLVDPPDSRFGRRSIGDDVCIIDMRRGAYVLSSPEVSLLRLAQNQVAGEFYRFPGPTDGGIRLFPDAKEPGIQASMEAALLALADLCHGVYSYDEDPECWVGILGSLDGNLSLCPEQALIDYEMFQYLERFARGIEVSPETIAFDLIAEVGPGGVFTDREHTARHLRQEMWFPRLLHRGAWDAWVESGRKGPLDLARDQVQEYLKADLEPVLSDDRLREVRKVVQEAERALLGRTTGILP